MNRIAAQVHGGTATEGEVVANVLGVRNRNAERRFDFAELADRPAGSDFQDPIREGVIAIVKGFEENQAALSRRRDHLLGLRCVGCEGLLAEHVLALPERLESPLGVKTRGKRIVDRVDIRIADQRLVAGIDLRDAVLLGESAGALGVARRNRHHLGARRASGGFYQGIGCDLRRTQDTEPK